MDFVDVLAICGSVREVGCAHSHVDEHGVLVGADARRAIAELWHQILVRPGMARAVSA